MINEGPLFKNSGFVSSIGVNAPAPYTKIKQTGIGYQKIHSMEILKTEIKVNVAFELYVHFLLRRYWKLTFSLTAPCEPIFGLTGYDIT